jgi:hypothetical protein
MNIKRTDETAYNPVFLKILEDIPGGITISAKDIPSDVTDLLAGLPLVESATTTGLYNLVKTAKATSTQTANVSITVKRPHLFKVGEFIAKDGGCTSSTISSVTHTATTTDTIVTGTAIGALATATRLINALTRAASTIAGGRPVKYSPSCLLRNNVQVRNSDLSTIYNATAGAVVRGTVDESALPYYVTTNDKTALTARLRFA